MYALAGCEEAASDERNDVDSTKDVVDGLGKAIERICAGRFPGRRSADGKPVRVTENLQQQR
jgi:hypothetical protein